METFSGKNLDEAIELAVKSLSVSDKSELDINIIEQGSKGLIFGIGAKNAVIEAKVSFNPKTIVEQFLKEITSAMGLQVEIKIKESDNGLYINLIGENLGVLIGKHGQTLDSIQHLTNEERTKNKGRNEDKKKDGKK